MPQPILTIAVACEMDVIASRQRARQIAAECGFGSHDQARIATAVSELARNVFSYAGEGRVGFSLSGTTGRYRLEVVIEDAGTGIPDLEVLLAQDERSQPGGWSCHRCGKDCRGDGGRSEHHPGAERCPHP